MGDQLKLWERERHSTYNSDNTGNKPRGTATTFIHDKFRVM